MNKYEEKDKAVYYWSFDDEIDLWTKRCSSLKECLYEALDDRDFYDLIIDKVYIAQSYDAKMDIDLAKIDASAILDLFFDKIDDEYGECAEDWIYSLWDSLRGSSDKDKSLKVLEDKVSKAIIEWIEEKGLAVTQFGHIDEVRLFDLDTLEEDKTYKFNR